MERALTEHDSSPQMQAIEAEAQLHAAERLTGVATFEFNAETGAGMASPEFRLIHGLDPTDSSPIPATEYLELLHPRDLSVFVELMDLLQTDGSVLPVTTWRIRRPDGAMRTLRTSATALGNGRIAGTTQDITDLQNSDRALALHMAVSQGLIDWDSPGGGAQGLVRSAAMAVDGAAALLWARDAREGALRPRAVWVNPDVSSADEVRQRAGAQRLRSGQGLAGAVWATQTATAVSSLLDRKEHVWRLESDDQRLSDALAVPLDHASKMVGVLELYAANAREVAEGTGPTLELVGSLLGEFLDRHRLALDASPISSRERQVLQLAAQGGSVNSIAETLMLSPHTVKTHFEHLYAKLGVRDRPAAVAKALRWGLIT